MKNKPNHNIQIRRAEWQDRDVWNCFLQSQEGNTPLGRYEWRQVIESSYGLPTSFLIAEREGETVGIVSAYWVSDVLGDRRIYTGRAGIWWYGDDVLQGMLSEISNLLKAISGCEAEVSSPTPISGNCSGSVEQGTTLQIPLLEESAMWSSLRDKTRNMVRRASRDGVTVKTGHQFLDIFYEQYQSNMLRLGVHVHRKVFFENILKILPENTEIMVAVWNNKIIASMMLHFGGDVACYPFQNAEYEYRKLAPIQLLNWEAMRFCADKGAKFLDMGPSSAGSPVFKSKVNFGGIVKPTGSITIRGRRPDDFQHSVLRRGIGRLDTFLQSSAPVWVRRLYSPWKAGNTRVL